MRYYGNVLYPHYFGSRNPLDQPGDFGALSRDSEVFFTPFWFTQAAFASPSYWNDRDDLGSPSDYRAVRTFECIYPSSKVLLLHSVSGFGSPSANTGIPKSHALLGLADGSAGAYFVTPRQLDNSIPRPYGCAPFPFMATLDGMHGRDLE